MKVTDILTIVSVVASFLFTVLIPTVVVLINKIKALKAAKTEAERQAIINDISKQAQTFITNAETLYSSVDAVLKNTGKSTGALKKDKVMTQIQQQCISFGIEFDENYWNNEVEKLVTLTKEVNAKDA